MLFFFKQKTAYDMRIRDWSSDVCSSDLLGGFLFGWAKPVPVDYRNLKNPHRDMALVAAAGPLSNAAMAIGWGLLLKLAPAVGAGEGVWMGMRYMAVAGIIINMGLTGLNQHGRSCWREKGLPYE